MTFTVKVEKVSFCTMSPERWRLLLCTMILVCVTTRTAAVTSTPSATTHQVGENTDNYSSKWRFQPRSDDQTIIVGNITYRNTYSNEKLNEPIGGKGGILSQFNLRHPLEMSINTGTASSSKSHLKGPSDNSHHTSDDVPNEYLRWPRGSQQTAISDTLHSSDQMKEHFTSQEHLHRKSKRNVGAKVGNESGFYHLTDHNVSDAGKYEEVGHKLTSGANDDDSSWNISRSYSSDDFSEPGEEVFSNSSDSDTPGKISVEFTGHHQANRTCRLGIHVRDHLPVIDGSFANSACFWCYMFVPPHRKKWDLEIHPRMQKFLFNNQSYVSIDPSNSSTWAEVASSLIDPVEADKLAGCCMEAGQCCDDMTQGPPDPGHCPPTWDGWSCLPRGASPDTSLPVRCPVHAYTGYPECYMYGVKRCYGNGTWESRGTWEHTDYTGCSMESYLHRNYIWEITVHGLSLLALTPALVVLLSYKALRLHRFRMHLNFFLALWLRSTFKILEVAILKMPENLNASTILEDNGPACKVLVTLGKMASLSVWSWMLAESVYLYRLIARAFSRVTTILPYVISAWCGPLLLTAVWAVCRALLEDFQCWLGDTKGDAMMLYLITEVPVLLILIVCTVLLVDMGRIMFLQLRGRRTTDQTDVNKRTLKATLFLVPMFGGQFLLTAVAPTGLPCTWMQGYIMLATALSGLQGLYVSVFYCYRNNDVMKQLRTTMLGAQQQFFPGTLESRTDTSGRYRGMGADSSSMEPQTTFSTVQSSDDQGKMELVPLRN